MVLQANDLHVPHLLAFEPQETGHIEQRGRFACSSAAAIEQSTQKGGGRGYGNPVSGNAWIMIRFGLWSTILLVGSVHGVIVAVLLLKAGRNRVANRFLAALLLAVVLLITPFTIGYAGLYDAYPWLSFAPFFWQLGFGPLLYFYVRRLATGRLPTGWAWHFVPMALQGFYYILAFCLPMARKLSWNHGGHTHVVLPIQATLSMLSFAIYWLASVRFYRRYQAWLENCRGDREEYRLPWMNWTYP